MTGSGNTRPGAGGHEAPLSGHHPPVSFAKLASETAHDVAKLASETAHDAPPTTLRLRLRRTIARLLVRGADTATRWVIRLLGETAMTGRAQLTEAELRDLVASSTVLDREERRLIDEVLAVGARHVRELMVPRTEVVYLDSGLPIADAARMVRGLRHSRFPVVDGSHDDVVGFVHLRDLLIRPEGDPAATVGELARELRRLPASKRALAALSEMRREGDHLALVVDEYGGTAGIVTLEDLLEELVGEIHDEYDAAPEPTDGAIPSEVDGRLNLPDFAERVGFSLPAGPYDTVGGFLMARLGKMPSVGDEVRVSVNGTSVEWRLAVIALDGRRVDRVALAPVGPPAPVPVPAGPDSPDVDLVPGGAVGGERRPAGLEEVVGDPAGVGALQPANPGQLR
jgi:putative hemolysin